MAISSAPHDSRARILDLAVKIASKEGILALTFGRLAKSVRMSKSGLFAHFGSRDVLCADVVTEAGARFLDAVLPKDGEASIADLRDLIVRYMRYCAGLTVDDAAFLPTAVREAEALPQLAHQRLRALHQQLTSTIEKGVVASVGRGEMRSWVDPAAFAFAAVGFGLSTACLAALQGNRETAFELGKKNVDVILHDLATTEGARLLQAS